MKHDWAYQYNEVFVRKNICLGKGLCFGLHTFEMDILIQFAEMRHSACNHKGKKLRCKNSIVAIQMVAKNC